MYNGTQTIWWAFGSKYSLQALWVIQGFFKIEQETVFSSSPDHVLRLRMRLEGDSGTNQRACKCTRIVSDFLSHFKALVGGKVLFCAQRQQICSTIYPNRIRQL
ncbi:hypothetical protein FKM82_015474 [Ascaphus truei]